MYQFIKLNFITNHSETMRTITGCRYKALKMEDFSLDWWDSWYRAAVPFQLMISGVVFLRPPPETKLRTTS